MDDAWKDVFLKTWFGWPRFDARDHMSCPVLDEAAVWDMGARVVVGDDAGDASAMVAGVTVPAPGGAAAVTDGEVLKHMPYVKSGDRVEGMAGQVSAWWFEDLTAEMGFYQDFPTIQLWEAGDGSDNI